jgi:hypothetical protein
LITLVLVAGAGRGRAVPSLPLGAAVDAGGDVRRASRCSTPALALALALVGGELSAVSLVVVGALGVADAESSGAVGPADGVCAAVAGALLAR